MGDTYNIEVASIYGAKTKQGLVELIVQLHDDPDAKPIKIQMDIPKAREVLGMLTGAIEAAVTDGLLVRFLTENVGLGEEAAARALLDFREMRQGSRKTVYPH